MDLLKEDIHRLSPKAIPIQLLLSRDLGIMCYASGTGGSDYMAVASIAFKQLSIEMPLTLIWPSKDVYHGYGQSEAIGLLQLKKQSEIVPYLETLKQKDNEYREKVTPLIEERNQRIRDGRSIQTLLSDLSKLKEEQRKIRRLIKMGCKVKNAIYMNPCIVDYAVNFGMANAEIQWRENLLNNNSLVSPIFMTTAKE
jgi:hypothetical protein